MSAFYKMDPSAWDFGTADLSLEEEAAYLRIVNAIHKHDGPVPNIDRVLAGMFRCSTRKARALVDALTAAGKLTIEGGLIWNDRARSDLVHRQFVSISSAERGAKGGRARAENAAKALEDNMPKQAIASSRIEENRDKGSVSKDTGVEDAKPDLWGEPLRHLIASGVKERQARALMGRWRKQSGDEAVLEALRAAYRAKASDWVSYVTAALKPKLDAHDQKLAAWGIGDAQPVRTEQGSWDRTAEASAGEADLSAVQPPAEAGEPEDEMPFGDADDGGTGGVLPSLRLVGGGKL